MDDAIRNAAKQLLLERGYSSTTVDEIATAAGVAKSTVYRRYPTKHSLFSDALADLFEIGPLPDTGELRSDLEQLVRRLAEVFVTAPGIALLGGILAESQNDIAALDIYRERVIEPRRAEMKAILTRSLHRKELRTNIPLDTLLDAAVGSLLSHQIHQGSLNDEWIESLSALLCFGAHSEHRL